MRFDLLEIPFLQPCRLDLDLGSNQALELENTCTTQANRGGSSWNMGSCRKHVGRMGNQKGERRAASRLALLKPSLGVIPKYFVLGLRTWPPKKGRDSEGRRGAPARQARQGIIPNRLKTRALVVSVKCRPFEEFFP